MADEVIVVKRTGKLRNQNKQFTPKRIKPRKESKEFREMLNDYLTHPETVKDYY